MRLTQPADLWRLTCADFILRTAYQMGKTPILPLFAASLAASETMIGMIMAISTGTGLVMKPLFGFLSDRGHRRRWLLFGVLLFVAIPFVYPLVENTSQLLMLRLFHGFSTAIFGPVSLAMIMTMGEISAAGEFDGHRAERLGWFGMGRTASYLVAPLLAVSLLSFVEIEVVFMIIGGISMLAVIPLLGLDSQDAHRSSQQHNTSHLRPKQSWGNAISMACRAALNSPAIWIAGVLEFCVNVSTYALKAFLPIYALTIAGFDLLSVGIYFALQETAHLVIRPLGGRMADRMGYVSACSYGFLVLAIGIALVSYHYGTFAFLVSALLIGSAKGLIFPATLALAGSGIDRQHIGTGMGVLGALRNSGKIAGPVIVGLSLSWYSHAQLFQFLALATTFIAIILLSVNFGQGQNQRRIGRV